MQSRVNSMGAIARLTYPVLGAILFALLFVSGCAGPDTVKPVSQPEPQPEPVIEIIPEPEKEPVQKIIPEPEPFVRPDTDILLSSNAGAYRNIAKMLSGKLEGDTRIFIQTGNKVTDSVLIDSIQSSSRSQLVAIGLRAAKAAAKVQNKQVVFSQVFNHRDAGLISPSMKAVSAMPSPEELFRDWKQLAPGLSQVAVITGKNLDDYIDRAKKAAEQQGIQLIHQQVRNDKEFLYAVKHLPLSVQGHWLLPDNRVLSLRVLKDVMAFNTKSGKQTVVFDKKLLSFGGLLYVKPSADEVSKLILLRLQDAVNQEAIPGADVMPVMSNEKGINATVAAQLNVKIPEEFKKLLHE
ncbi:MAG: hypothetical protein OQL06_05645 [Gammaproteobacteria bacterium]|nr:hypothetical protein [Gammaproteobacteria bacterium]